MLVARLERRNNLLFLTIVALITYVFGMLVGMALEGRTQRVITQSYERQIDHLRNEITNLLDREIMK